MLENERESSSPSGVGSPGRRFVFDITKETMEFAHCIAWGHEGVWGCLRTILASDELLEKGKCKELFGMVENWVEVGGGLGQSASEEARRERELEKRSLEWVRRRRGEE